MDKFQKWFAIWTIADPIIRQLLLNGGVPHAPTVAAQVQVELQRKITQGYLHEAVLEGADDIIKDVLIAHPDVKYIGNR